MATGAMGPQKPTLEHTIDRTPEYEDFIARVRAFHEARGTHFEPEPRIGNANVDLLKLYKHIMVNGGYDKVSEEKLLWRKMCTDLSLMTSNPPSAAFSLKTIFYRFLAAYEIRTEYNKEPPPPDILENTTARGGNLLTRTRENYQTNRIIPPEQSEVSADEATPARDRRAEEAPASGRAARGLREAPPQRVIFQPEPNSSRQPRHSSGQHPNHATPTSHPQSHQQSQPHHLPHSHSHLQHVPAPQQHTQRGPSYTFKGQNADNFSASVENYEPRQNVPVPLRPVETPGNNPEAFARRQRLLKQQQQQQALPVVSSTGTLPFRQALPTGPFDGPNIYVRCFQALRSKIQEEQAFGLNHLVKISFERGDKYRFEQFHGLAEGLTEKALEVGSLFYNVNWTICYDGDSDELAVGELDGVNGTADILDRISALTPKDVQDSLQPAGFSDQLVLITEAVLTIRNMVMLPENALYMAEFPTIKDLLCIILHIPKCEMAVELKHFALDIAEQVTPFLALDMDDPLYQTLLGQLTSTDRGAILTALRAVGRISMNLSETNKLGNVPPVVLENIVNWLLLNDNDLMDACLDFLYQYTAVVPNVENLLKATKAENLVSHLVRLLSHGAKRVHRDFILEHEKKQGSTEEVIQIPKDLLERLLTMEEPERSFAWLRCFFEEDPDSSITQITIWHAYNAAFANILQQTGRVMINAADFIRNISQVYQNAGAQITREPGTDVQKFIIKGIRSRVRPISPEGREYFSCLWSVGPVKLGPPRKCGNWFIDSEKMYEHIITAHLGERRGEDKLYQDKLLEYQCLWGACRKYAKPTTMHLAELMSHVKTHLAAAQHKEATSNGASDSALTPGGSSGNSGNNHKRHKRPYVVPAKAISLTYEETMTLPRDERNPNSAPQAAGSPLSAVLVLRNIARNAAKTDAVAEEDPPLRKRNGAGGEAGGEAGRGWNEKLFRPLLPRLFEIMTENRALAPYVALLLQALHEE